MTTAAARYREFAPCEALREYVRAFFAFTAPPGNDVVGRRITREVWFGADDPSWSALFADAHVSVVFSFGSGYRVEGLWDPRPAGPGGHVIGAMSTARTTSPGNGLASVGVYLRAAKAQVFTGVPACELTDRIVALTDLWRDGIEVEMEIGEVDGDAARVNRLEAALLRRIEGERGKTGPLDVPGLAAHVIHRRGQVTVERLAEAAGVSRQHLTRAFRESVGVSPKLYCRLARFREGLAYVGRGKGVDWAQAAIEAGYADQSHMIAEFREFSGHTPAALALQRTFHPFIA